MDDVSTYADEHENGQLRIGVAGEQMPLLGLPDSAIPTTDAPHAVDVVRCRDVAELLGDPLAELTPAAVETLRGQGKLLERVLGSDAAIAVGRFEPDGPSGYRAKSGGPVRETRAEAEADELVTLERGPVLESPYAEPNPIAPEYRGAGPARRSVHCAECGAEVELLEERAPCLCGAPMPAAGDELEPDVQNLGGNITRTRERLEQLKRAAVTVAAGGRGYGRPMVSRFASSCAECPDPIGKGDAIVYYKLTREAVHAACDNPNDKEV